MKNVVFFLTEDAMNKQVGIAAIAAFKSGGKLDYAGESTEEKIEEYMPGLQFAGRKEFPYPFMLVTEVAVKDGETLPELKAFPTTHIPKQERKVYPRKADAANAANTEAAPVVVVPETAVLDANKEVGKKESHKHTGKKD